MTFDFVLKNNNAIICAIEYDGQQHFKNISFSNKETNPQENLYFTKLRDNIKTEYCKNKNIPLIRIPYWEKDNLEYFLFDRLVKFGLIEELNIAS